MNSFGKAGRNSPDSDCAKLEMAGDLEGQDLTINGVAIGKCH